MIRLAAVPLALLLASPALALPVSYDFVATDSSGSYDGRFTYEGEQLVGLVFSARLGGLPYLLDLVTGDGEGWPTRPELFPVHSWGPAYLELNGDDLFVAGELRTDLTLADLQRSRITDAFAIALFCETGAPLDQCPEESTVFDDGFAEFRFTVLRQVPEPSAVATLLLAATALLATGSCRRRPLRR